MMRSGLPCVTPTCLRILNTDSLISRPMPIRKSGSVDICCRVEIVTRLDWECSVSAFFFWEIVGRRKCIGPLGRHPPHHPVPFQCSSQHYGPHSFYLRH